VQPEAVWAYGDLLNELRKSKRTAPGIQEPVAQAPIAHAPETGPQTGTEEQASR